MNFTGRKNSFLYNIVKYRMFYLMLLPGIILVFIFKYVPMYGLQIAFKDYYPWNGFVGSPWVGLAHFRDFLSSVLFTNLLRNTLGISVLKMLVAFPASVIFAILLNELKLKKFVRFSQTITYLPNFFSWVIIFGLFYFIFNENYGVFSSFISNLGFDKPKIIGNSEILWPLLVLTSMWKETGWGSIVFLAAISGIDNQIYDAADVDGAGRFQKIFYIVIPSIMPLVAIMLILKIGYILNEDFEQILMFIGQNSLLQMKGDVFETYTYRISIEKGAQYSYATAIGLFKSFVGFFMVMGANKIAKTKFNYRGLF